jgi:hypothetical protein
MKPVAAMHGGVAWVAGAGSIAARSSLNGELGVHARLERAVMMLKAATAVNAANVAVSMVMVVLMMTVVACRRGRG